jgi:hypothetical protein
MQWVTQQPLVEPSGLAVGARCSLAKQHSSSSSSLLEAEALAAALAVPQLLLLLAGACLVLLRVEVVLLGRAAALPRAPSLAKQQQRVAVVVSGLAAVRHQLGVVGLGLAVLQLVAVPRRCLELQRVVVLVALAMTGSLEASL